MDRNINTIIEECVKTVLSEMDLVPTDNQGNANLIRKQSINANDIKFSMSIMAMRGFMERVDEVINNKSD